VTWRQAVQRLPLTPSLLKMNQIVESSGHRDVKKMCPGWSPTFPDHGDRTHEDHRYIEFWFICILSLSVPPCDQC
jgi:hypothetical protein